MTVIQVTEHANRMSGVFTNPYIVKNSGAFPVYLGQDSSLSVASRAFSIEPGGTLKWLGKTELWAITNPGQVSELEVLYDSDSSFTPGPSVVTLNNTGQNVFTDLAVVENVGNDYISANFDASSYASLRFSWAGSLNAVAPYTGDKDLSMAVLWLTDGVSSGREEIGLPGAGSANFDLAVKGEEFTLTIQTNDGTAISANGAAVLNIVGFNYARSETYECLPDITSYNLTNFVALTFPPDAFTTPMVQQRYYSVAGSVGAGTIAILPLAHRAGAATLAWGRVIQVGAGSLGKYMRAQRGTAYNDAYVSRIRSLAATTLEDVPTPLILPKTPLALIIESSAGVTGSFIHNYQMAGD